MVPAPVHCVSVKFNDKMVRARPEEGKVGSGRASEVTRGRRRGMRCMERVLAERRLGMSA